MRTDVGGRVDARQQTRQGESIDEVFGVTGQVGAQIDGLGGAELFLEAEVVADGDERAGALVVVGVGGQLAFSAFGRIADADGEAVARLAVAPDAIANGTHRFGLFQ